jgi:ABC-type glycerol-3-phosphate transport system permease component
MELALSSLTIVTTLPLAQYNDFGVPSVLVSNNQHWTLTIKYLSSSAKGLGQYDMRPFDSPFTSRECKTNIAIKNVQR